MTERYQDQQEIECLFADTFHKIMMEQRFGLSVCWPDEDPDLIDIRKEVSDYINNGGEIIIQEGPCLVPVIITKDHDQICYNILKLDVSGNFKTYIGDDIATYFTIHHNLHTLDVMIEVYDIRNGETKYPTVSRLDIDTVKISCTTAPPN